MPADWLDHVRAELDQAVNTHHELSDTLRDEHTKHLEELDRKEDYYLDLAADQGWPKDKLRAKIDQIRRTRRDIEDILTQSAQQLDQGRDIFHAALALLTEPQHAYEHGNETVRGILNMAFFTKLYIDAGKVIDHHAQEPFDALAEHHRVYQLNRNTRCPRRQPTPTHTTQARRQHSSNPASTDQGWNKPLMAGLKEALSYPCPQVRRLLGMVETWAVAPADEAELPILPSYQPRQRPSLATHIGEAGVQTLIAGFRAGATTQDLAERHGYSVSSVKRLLRERGVRRWKKSRPS